MILNYYGDMVTLSELNRKMEVGRDGLSLSKMKCIFSDYNMEAKLYKTCSIELSDYNYLTPFIALEKEGHYVIVEKIDKTCVRIVDPAVGKRALTHKEYRDKFIDRIFSVVPGEDFKPIKKTKKKSIFADCIKNNKKSFAGMFAIALVVYIMMFAAPLLSREVLDVILGNPFATNELLKWTKIILVAFVSYMLVLFFKAKADVRLSIVIDKFLSNSVVDKLFKNDIKFFQERTSADIQYRFSLLRGVKSLINEIVVTTVLDAGSMVVILGYVFVVAPRYLSILIVSSVIVLGMKFLLRGRVILYKNEETAADSKLQVLQNDIFRSITDVKVLGVQKAKKEQWSNSFNEYIRKHKKYETLMAKYQSILSGMNMFVPIFAVILGAWYINETGDIAEIAVVVSLQTVLSLYLTSLLSVSNMVDNMYLIRSYMTRIEDIMEQEDEIKGDKKIDFKGNINVKNLSFK